MCQKLPADIGFVNTLNICVAGHTVKSASVKSALIIYSALEKNALIQDSALTSPCRKKSRTTFVRYRKSAPTVTRTKQLMHI